MSFLNFSNNKSNTEHLDTTEIKQAAISDTQLNSLNTAPSTPESNASQASVSSEQNFVNPFTKPEEKKNEVLSSPTQTSSSPTPDLNASVSPTPASEPRPVQSAQLGQDLNQLNQNLTQSIQSQESMGKDQIKELIDETVEKVIEEKWDTLTEKVDRVLRWKEKKEEEINMLKEDIVNIADGFSKLENKLINKISNYDKNILDVNSEIKALEKVFQKVTPTLINNVNELSRIADDLKGVKSSKKEDSKKE